MRKKFIKIICLSNYEDYQIIIKKVHKKIQKYKNKIRKYEALNSSDDIREPKDHKKIWDIEKFNRKYVEMKHLSENMWGWKVCQKICGIEKFVRKYQGIKKVIRKKLGIKTFTEKQKGMKMLLENMREWKI